MSWGGNRGNTYMKAECYFIGELLTAILDLSARDGRVPSMGAGTTGVSSLVQRG